MKDINFISIHSLVIALKRGKTNLNLSHEEVCNGIAEELDELRQATDEPSEHIPPYTQRQEELADIILAALTELEMLSIRYYQAGRKDIADLASNIITDKLEYNKTRKD